MNESIPVQTPGGFAPGMTIGLDDGTGHFVSVSDSKPLPVRTAAAPATQPLEGFVSGDVLVGPFEPNGDRVVVCTLTGTWEGSVRLRRSVDGGQTTSPVTLAGADWARFTANACEPVWQESEDGATLWLDCRIISGALNYRLAQ